MRPPARIPRSTGQHVRKPKPGIRRDHLAFIRQLPCVSCRRSPPSEPAHVRITRADMPGSGAGSGQKPADRYTTPLCQDCHRRQHNGESTFWSELGIDALDLSLRLWSVSGNLEMGLRAVERAWQGIALHQRTT